MSKANLFRYLKLTRFSKPRHLRQLYKALVDSKARRIVEVGIGDGSRALDMISLALRSGSDKPVRYTGVDLFESRPGDDAITLKSAYKLLRNDAYEVQLIPGEPAAALKRSANELRGTDVIVVSSEVEQPSLDAAWHLLSRMMHKDSRVWIERCGSRFEVLTPADLRGPQRKVA